MENQNCKILADSINSQGDRLTSILFKRFPYCLIQEPATHRMNSSSAINPFGWEVSRNSASTRAIPLKKLIEQVKADPFIPTFELDQRGMSGQTIVDKDLLEVVRTQWLIDLDDTIDKVTRYDILNIHKSKPAKLLIPFLRIPVLVSSTSWLHFFKLRCDDSADADLRDQAQNAYSLWTSNTPKELKEGDWHIPFNPAESLPYSTTLVDTLKIAAANIARLSYTSFDGNFSPESNIKLAHTLIDSKHWSPYEHIASALNTSDRIRNFTGFRQYRDYLDNGN